MQHSHCPVFSLIKYATQSLWLAWTNTHDGFAFYRSSCRGCKGKSQGSQAMDWQLEEQTVMLHCCAYTKTFDICSVTQQMQSSSFTEKYACTDVKMYLREDCKQIWPLEWGHILVCMLLVGAPAVTFRSKVCSQGESSCAHTTMHWAQFRSSSNCCFLQTKQVGTVMLTWLPV